MWDVGDVAAGQRSTLAIRATVNPGTDGTTITNVASIQVLDQTDADPSNDDGTQPISVLPASGTNAGGGGELGTGGTAATGANIARGLSAMLFLSVIGAFAVLASRRRRHARDR